MHRILWLVPLLLVAPFSAELGRAQSPHRRLLVAPADARAHFQPPKQTTPARLVIEADSSWQALWSAALPGGPRTLPSVDLARERAVIVALGGQPTTGVSIRIERAYVERDTVVVEVRMTRTGYPCAVHPAFTYPADAVRLPRTAQPLRFIDLPVRQRCSG
jgi:PrcB C-terminal